MDLIGSQYRDRAFYYADILADLLGQDAMVEIDLGFDDPSGEEHELGAISATIEVAKRLLDAGI